MSARRLLSSPPSALEDERSPATLRRPAPAAAPAAAPRLQLCARCSSASAAALAAAELLLPL
eukprot:1407109-Alexandrium_andersonii.AAC.1